MKKTFSRLSCVLLAVVMLVGLLPAGMVAFAADAAVTSVEYNFAVGAANNTGLFSSDGYDTYDETGKDWACFDVSEDYKNTSTDSITSWAARLTTWSSSHNAKMERDYLKIADYTSDTTYDSEDAWVAFKFKSSQPLEPGKYTISFNVLHSGPGRGNDRKDQKLTAYVAEYVKGQDDGAYYKDAANKVFGATKITVTESGNNTNVDGPKAVSATTTFDVTNPNAEFVLVLELEGLEIWLDSFTIEKTGDFAESHSFTIGKSAFYGADIVHDDQYKNADPENRPWRFYDAADCIKNQEPGTNYAGDVSNSSDGLGLKTFDSSKTPGWIALITKPTNSLKPGEYKAEIRTNATQSEKPLYIYVAEYDPESGKTAADYATPDNLGFSGTTGSDYVDSDDRFVITNPNAELVVIFRMGDLTSDVRMRAFKLTYTGPVPAEEQDTITYDFQQTTTPKIESGTFVTDLNSYVATGRNWKWLTADPDFLNSLTRARFGRMSSGRIEIDSKPNHADEQAYRVENAWHSFVLDAPKAAGIYALDIASVESASTIGKDDEKDSSAIWVADYTGSAAAGYMTDKNLMNDNELGWYDGGVTGKKYISVGEDTDELIFLVQDKGTGENSKIAYEQITLTPVDVESRELVLSSDRISLEETATAGLVINGEKPLMHSAVEYSASGVVTISDTGVITPTAEGDAVITATYGDITERKAITVGSSKNLLTGDVNVYVHSIVNGVAGEGKAGITTEDGIAIGEVNTVARGEVITLTASGLENKKFSHWQTASGTFLSDDDTYTFTANTNTVVVGVYENAGEADDENVTVSFYDGFGGRIEQKTFAKGTVFSIIAPDVTELSFRGYIFSHWASADYSDEQEVNKNTIAVAQYTEEPTKYTVTINDGESVEYAYNAEVKATSEADNFSYWMRGDKIVSYDKIYTFNVWGDTELEEVKDGPVDAAPIVVLEKDGNEYMVEYSLPVGCSFVEAGIVSGSGTPTVGSFNKKASSKRLSENHGQFTAKTTDTVVRGYVIYRDAENDLVVAYSN